MKEQSVSKQFFDWIISIKAICFESVLRCPFDCLQYYAGLCDWRKGTRDEFLTIPHSINATVIFLSVEELRVNNHFHFETSNIFLIDKENRKHRVFPPCSYLSDWSADYLCLMNDSSDSDEGLFLFSESIVEESFQSIRFFNPRNPDDYIDFTADELLETTVGLSEYLSTHTSVINNKQLVRSQISESMEIKNHYYEITRRLFDHGVLPREIVYSLLERIKRL